MKAIIPVAGLGTRFLPATKTQPKEMLPLIDKPVIQYIVEEIVNSGITDIVFVTSSHKRALEDFFDSNNELELALIKKNKDDELKELERIEDIARFSYVRQKRALGNADAVMMASHLFKNEPIVVAFGDDVFIPGPVTKHIIDIYNEHNSPACILRRIPKKDSPLYGIVKAEKVGERKHRILDIVEKPSVEEAPSDLSAIGRYLLTPEVISCIEKLYPPKPGKEVGITDAIKEYLNDGGEFYGYEVDSEQYFDCGSKINFIKTIIHLGLQREEFKDELREYLGSLEL